MIRLFDIEKQFLKDIIIQYENHPTLLLGNLMDKHLSNIKIVLDFNRKNVFFNFDNNYYSYSQETALFVRKLTWNFIRIIKLLKYLEQENYLFLIQETDEKINSLGNFCDDNDSFSYDLVDQEIISIILECSPKTIIIGQSLIDFVKNDFRTQDEINHIENINLANENLILSNKSLEKASESLEVAKKELKVSQSSYENAQNSLLIAQKDLNYAKKSYIVAIIAIFISVILNFFILYNSDKNELKKNQIENDSLHNLINSLNVKFDNSIDIQMDIKDAVEKIKFNDTLNAKLVQPIKLEINSK